MRIALKECWVPLGMALVGAALGAAGLASGSGWTGLWQGVLLAGLGGTAGVLYFFRDPERVPFADARAVLAPADGTVVAVEPGVAHPFLKGQGTRISIFLSVFNVHVQRAPIEGAVECVEHRPGRFLPAWEADASSVNEQNAIGFRRDALPVMMCQIAGVLARRTVSWVGVGDAVRAGDRVGLIKFGSRVDLYVPASVDVMVRPREKVKGGLSVVGRVR